jgi:hypothetical protein
MVNGHGTNGTEGFKHGLILTDIQSASFEPGLQGREWLLGLLVGQSLDPSDGVWIDEQGLRSSGGFL